MIYLQLLILLLIVIVSYYLNHRDYMSPGFIFAMSFAFSSFWACMYAKEWGLGLHGNTFLVIIGGVLLFVVASGIVHIHSNKKRRAFIQNKQSANIVQINIENWKTDLFIVLEIIIILSYVLFLIRRGNASGSLTDSIYDFRNERTSGEVSEGLPFFLRIANYGMIAAGYWFGYVLVNNCFMKRKIELKIAIIVVLSVVFSLMEGGRNNSLNIMLSIVVYAIIFNKRKKHFKDGIKPKTVAKLGALAAAALYGMVYFANALGRKLLFTPMYYLAVYCGSEIKNLDIFLNSARTTPTYVGEQTFVNIVKAFGKYFISGFDQNYSINPYQRYNGYYLGNVYTTFKAYIHDFGYIGMVLLVIIMALICQISYEKALIAKCRSYPSFDVLFYGFLFNTILFSFFSNKFYENLFSLRFARYVLFWCIFYLFFCKIRIRKARSASPNISAHTN